jgi:hypothetical protein
MSEYLRIQGDPNIWELGEPVDEASLTSGKPIQVTTLAPLAGTLVLAARAAASVVLFNPPPVGVIPSDAKLPTPFLYLPAATKINPDPPPGYPLTAETDLAALAVDIATAMSEGTFYAVGFAGGVQYGAPYNGVLLLNGATLPFVVICQASPGS